MRHHSRSRSAHHIAWFWALAWLVLMKAAVPLLATVAASTRGVDLVEVCSVYGVRTVDVAPQTGEGPAPQLAGHGAADGHCALSTVLGSASLLLSDLRPPLLPAAVGLWLPARSRQIAFADPVRRWLAGRLHAPPWRA